MEDWLCPELNGHDARSQMRGLETIFTAPHNGRGFDSSPKRRQMFVYSRVECCGQSLAKGTLQSESLQKVTYIYYLSFIGNKCFLLL